MRPVAFLVAFSFVTATWLSPGKSRTLASTLHASWASTVAHKKKVTHTPTIGKSARRHGKSSSCELRERFTFLSYRIRSYRHETLSAAYGSSAARRCRAVRGELEAALRSVA